MTEVENEGSRGLSPESCPLTSAHLLYCVRKHKHTPPHTKHLTEENHEERQKVHYRAAHLAIFKNEDE